MAIRNSDLFTDAFFGLLGGAPSLISAVANADGTSVQVTFDKALAGSSLMPSNFSIAGLTISAPVTQTGSVVTLPVSPMIQGFVYTLIAKAGIIGVGGGATQVNQQTTFAGVAIPAGRRNFDPKHFLTPREFFPGFAWRTKYQGPKKKTF